MGAHGVLATSALGMKYFADGGYSTYGMPDEDLGRFGPVPSLAIPDTTEQGFEKAIIVVPMGASAFTLDRAQPIVQYLQPLGRHYDNAWLSPVTCGLPQGACFVDTYRQGGQTQPYTRWRHYSLGTSAIGALAINGLEWNRWVSLGAENSPLGYPLRTSCSNDIPGGFCKTLYQQAVIYTTPTSAVIVKGAMLQLDGNTPFTGLYGIPLADEQCGLAQGGCRQEFSGATMAWTPALGARAVKGGIGAKWKSMGMESGRLGYPTGPESCFGWIVNNVDKSGCYQWFQGGIIWWSPASGTHVVWGAIMNAYERANWVWFDSNSSSSTQQMIGYPISDESCTGPGGGCYQWFENGIIWWSPATGAQRVINGDKSVYESLNWAWGPLGYPTTEEQQWFAGYAYPYSPWGTRQYFQRGYLTWTPRSGITVTYY